MVNPLSTSTSHYNCVGPQFSFAGGWVGGRGGVAFLSCSGFCPRVGLFIPRMN